MKVSVIVPVFNPGTHIDDLLASLAAQSLPAGEFEVVLVDDGSTDGTADRLDRLAAADPRFRVAHIPNSGWPSRPRNTGLDMARGEFVLFADNDDWLGAEALERLHARAVEDDADVVIGKVVGHRKSVPRVLFARNRSEVPLDWGPLWMLLSPHKLFRRALIEEHGIRFPEDFRRLEDHAFVVPAYFRARRISVLADYPVYHWVLRGREVNASTRTFDAAEYYRSLERVLDLVVAHTEPGEFRDWLLAHWFRAKMLRRVGGARFERLPEVREAVYEHVRALTERRFPPSFDQFLPFNYAVRATLLRAGELDGLVQLARVENSLRVEASVREVRPEADARAVEVDVEARLVTDDGPLLFARRGEGVVWLVPERLRPFLGAEYDARDAVERSSGRMLLRSVARGSEYVVRAAAAEAALEPLPGADGAHELVFRTTTRVAAASAAGGKPLHRGGWHLRIECRAGGFREVVTVARRRTWGPLTFVVGDGGTMTETRRSAPRRLAHSVPPLVWAAGRVRRYRAPVFEEEEEA